MTSSSTVLVVDDVDATRSGLAELLQLRGYRTREASNGADGLAWLRRDPHISVVVLDLAMPDSNGYWFRQEQLTDPAIAHVPVIVFTGHADPDTLTQRLQVSDVLRKPVAVDALFDAIGRCCANGPASAHI
jgi:CheY-like chemotaxis protein